MRNFIVIFSLLLISLSGCNEKTTDLAPVNMRVEYKENPFIETGSPRFSWELSSAERGAYQTAYQIRVASSIDILNHQAADLWNSGKVKSDATNQIAYEGEPLQSRQICYWMVRVWDKNGTPGNWSEPKKWEMTLLEKEDWKAQWIGYDLTNLGKGKVYHLPPAPYLRKEFALNQEIKKARLYVTALGLYQMDINGQKVGNQWLTPGWTAYRKRLHFQTYDVTEMVTQGNNAIGSTLSYGWYAGYTGYALLVQLPKVKAFYGEVPHLLAQLEVEYANGEKQVIVTDDTWKASQGPLLETDLLNGETYDANLEQPGWNKPGFDDSAWSNVTVCDTLHPNIELHPGSPVVVTDILRPKTITQRPGKKFIVDMGQNFAGVVTLNVKGKKGQKIVLRFGEMLHPDGRLMTENLRKARATDTYICKGDPDGESWTPQFTFHGFQFVEISGLDYIPDYNVITGLAFSSDNKTAGSFETDNPMVNQLYSNIVWTQKANFIEIPTDCPQRDERLGWTGDAQIYVSSAVLNNDVAAFFNKWIIDLNDSQWDFGAYPNFAPKPFHRMGMIYSPGWMEAGVICPYHIFKTYGDVRMVENSWPYMEKFMAFHEKKSEGKFFYPEASFEDIRPKGGFGDWLSIGKKTPPDFLASLYFGHCAELMSEMATAIGKPDRAEYYRTLFENIKGAVKKHYIDSDSRIFCNADSYGDAKGYVDGNMGFSGHTQTAYANTIYMNFLDETEKAKAGNYLAELVNENGKKLTTGFLGVKQLLPALSQTGNTSLAYTLLLNTEYPSWGFEIEQGATSIWERWNSYTKEGGFVSGMNSFSHYSFGSVYEWMFNHMAGIKNTGVGYKTFVIEPETDSRIGFVKASYHSINGAISSEWLQKSGELNLNVTIPVNTTATIKLPAASASDVVESGVTLHKDIAGIQSIREESGYVWVVIGSGSYRFTCKKQ